MREQVGVGKHVAIVLGGGGSRGALQVGALRALIEHGYSPDLLVGTSAGAINAAFLAIHGTSLASIDQLEAAWHQAAGRNLLPSNYVWTALRSMLRPSKSNPANRIREFLVESGVAPNLVFSDLQGPRLIIVSSDLNTGTPVLHGLVPTDPILDALLVSTALPPWVLPVRREGHYLMDGAVVSALPIQPALECGASDIVALDLTDPRDTFGQVNGFGVFLNSLTYAVEQRQVDLELELARARGVPVLHLRLNSSEAVPVWNFGRTGELISQGYELTKCALNDLHREEPVPPAPAPTPD
jgi:NTE family protein